MRDACPVSFFSPVGANDMQDAKEFLTALFREAQNHCVVSYGNVQGKHKPAETYGKSGAEIIKFIERYNVPGRAVYACVSDIVKGAKRSKQNVNGTLAAFADLDFKGIAHTRVQIEEAIELLPLSPSFVIFTGNGIHLWWLFEEKCHDVERVEKLLKHISFVLAGDPAVCEVSRVMRVPDTRNTKNGADHHVHILQRNDVRYTIEQLEEYFGQALPLLLRVESESPTVKIKRSAYEQYVASLPLGDGIDHDTMWDDVRYYGKNGGGNLHNTILRNVGSLLNFYPPDEVVERICADLKRIIPEASTPLWKWNEEIEDIRENHICHLYSKDLKLYEKWKDEAPKWVTDNPKIKSALKRRDREERDQRKKLEEAAAKGALNGSGKVNGVHLPIAGNIASAGSADDPIDLWEKLQPRPLPRGILPKVIEDFAFAQARLKGCDPAGLAMGALAAAGAAIPDSIQIKVKVHDHWTESARLWVILVGGVSTQKTPIYSEITREVKRIDAELARASGIELEQWEDQEKGERGPKPPQRRLVINDATVESVAELAQDNPDGLFMIRNEVSAWWGSMERYHSQKGGGDQPFWLEAYDGGSRTVDRIKRGNKRIENLGVSLVGGIQPDKIREHAEVASDDGLIQRAIPVILANAGKDIDEPMPPEAQLFDKLISTLNALPRQAFGSLSFTPEAQEIRQERADYFVDLGQKFEDYNTKLSSHIGKYRGMFARLCLIFHCIENPSTATQSNIEESTARRVSRFMQEFMLPHAVTFYMNVLDGGKELSRVRSVAGYIVSHKPTKPLTSRDVINATRSMRGLSKTEVDGVFYVLEAVGWITRGIQKRADSMPWVVNPRVYELFSERGELEKRRREAAQEEIKELFASKSYAKNAGINHNREASKR